MTKVTRLVSRMVAIMALGAAGGCSSSTAEDGVRAPRVLAAEPMAGGLHVSWENVEPACDRIELERRTAGLDGTEAANFATAYTLPGAADNKHDADVTERVTYIYRLRCEKGGRYSPYSNEVSGVAGSG